MTTLYHISYDARDAKDTEALRIEIPMALLDAEKSIEYLTEPVRSTFRFVADTDDEVRSRILTAVSMFANRCYFFVSASDSYVSEGKVYYPSRTEANKNLDSKFQELLATALKNKKGNKEDPA